MPSRTEREKMLAGEIYNCIDPGLKAERRNVKQLLGLYNRTEASPERQSLLRQLLGHLGEDSVIESPFHCVYGKNIHVGDHVFLNIQCAILDCAEVRIGDHVMFGPAVQVYTA